jgi:DNA integrity scanning protein DisA with diadenylate cyclase activity
VVIPIEEPETVPQESVSGVEIPDILVEAGFDTAESIRTASDKELLAISGVGKATLAQIREDIG